MPPRDDVLEILRDVPRLDIAFDGTTRQSLGVDLPIAAINLPHRTDRWDAVHGRMKAVGLDRLIKVPAVYGAELSLETIDALVHPSHLAIDANPDTHFAVTRPAIGCFLSHLGIWRWMIETGLPRVLVFEDDANPAPGFDAARFRATMADLERRDEMVFLGRLIMNGMAEDAAKVAPALPRMFYFNGTFAYLITPSAARVLIRNLLPIRGHIDHQISRVLIERRGEMAARYTEPHFFEPDWNLRSDCYVPLDGETEADRELGAHLDRTRRLLESEHRPLLPAFVPAE